MDAAPLLPHRGMQSWEVLTAKEEEETHQVRETQSCGLVAFLTWKGGEDKLVPRSLSYHSRTSDSMPDPHTSNANLELQWPGHSQYATLVQVLIISHMDNCNFLGHPVIVIG